MNALPATLAAVGLLVAPLGEAQDALFAGPMPAYSELRDVAVWLQTRRPAQVVLRYHPEGRPEAARVAGPLPTNEASDLIAVFAIGELEPGTRYRYDLEIDGTRVERPWPFGFRTQAPWAFRSDPPDFTAMLGSCAYVNDPERDRSSSPFGGGYGIFDSMAALSPDLMLWLGDNVYLRSFDLATPAGIAARYRYTRAAPELQRFLAATHHYATWDDHDFGPNDSDGSFQLKDAALDVFTRYWPGVRYGMPGTPGVFRLVRYADVAFFLLDDRYHRKPNAWPAGPDKRLLGEAQLQWLKEALVSVSATFRVIVLGNQFLRDTGHESFQAYADRQELFDWIRDRRLEGVLLVSGDRHMTELKRLERPSAYPLYEYTSSPLTSTPYTPPPGGAEATNPLRIPGTLLSERNFGTIRMEGKPAERRLVLRAHDIEGRVRWERVITRAELSLP